MTQVTRAINKRLIIGLGMTGLSAARYCQRQGWAFDLCDTRSLLAQGDAIRNEFPNSALYLGPLSTARLCQYEQLIVSPGVALAEPAIGEAIAFGVEVTGDVQIFADAVTAPIIAITGSNGKSTVTTLTAELLQQSGLRVAMGGNIGIPVLDLLTQSDVDVYVLELSSFQLETTPRLAAHSATVLNISADHMDRYADMNGYIAAKKAIFTGCQRVVINRDDPVSWPSNGALLSTSFGMDHVERGFALAQVDGQDVIVHDGAVRLRSDELRIKGRHNLANVMAALALAQPWITDWPGALQVVREFAGLSHRCQWVARVRGIDCYNDSKGTNVGSTLAAIHGLQPSTQGTLWLLAGGVGKGQDFIELGQVCQQYGIRVCLFGQDAGILNTHMAPYVAADRVSTLTEAVALVTNAATRGDVMLFSPACASFDQFAHYEARGDFFVSLVRTWQQECDA